MKVYELERDASARYTGHLNAAPRWFLPGLENCPGCGATWAAVGLHYPCVDLSEWPGRKDYEEPRVEPIDEVFRRMEQIRPLLPPGSPLNPGASFGPMTGRASGTFGSIHLQSPWTLCMQREAFEEIQRKGIRGLRGCPPNVTYKSKSPPDLLELQLEFHGRVHPDCLPTDAPPPCSRCGRESTPLPDSYVLDAKSLSETADVFRQADWPTRFLATERFVDAVAGLGLDGVVFKELPAR